METNKDLTITRKGILDLTFNGIEVYAHILHHYYPQDETVFILRGKKCTPAKNPFNGDALTLHICLKSNMAMHSDSALQSFQGNVFAFAAMHYQLKGLPLLEKINEDMDLGIHQNRQNGQSGLNGLNGIKGLKGLNGLDGLKGLSGVKGVNGVNGFNAQDRLNGQKSQYSQSGDLAPRFSYFQKPVRNTVPLGIRSLVDVYLLIKGTTYQKATEQLRAITDKVKARKFKEQNFDYATFSGVFTSRENGALVRHSGLFVVDFDHVADVGGLKQQLLKDAYFETELLFVSPSGNGLKWIITIDLQKATHQQWAQSISSYLLKTYGLKMDPSGKDVARACFIPHDPNVYIHPKYKV